MKLLILCLSALLTLQACAEEQTKWLVLEFVNEQNEGTYAKIRFTESFFKKEKGKRGVVCQTLKAKDKSKTRYYWAGNTIAINTSLNPESRGEEAGVISFKDLDTVYAFNSYSIESEDGGYKSHDMAIFSEKNFREDRRGGDKGAPEFEVIPEVSISKLKDIKVTNSFYCAMYDKKGNPVDP